MVPALLVWLKGARSKRWLARRHWRWRSAEPPPPARPDAGGFGIIVNGSSQRAVTDGREADQKGMTMGTGTRWASAVAVLLMFWCPQASAVPQLVVHEGLVLDEDGVPKSGPVAIRISLYAAASGGDALWFEDYDLVLVDGYYAVQLGSSEELGDVFDGGSRYLGVELDHGGELTPRHPVE